MSYELDMDENAESLSDKDLKSLKEVFKAL